IRASDSESRLEVASSRIRMRGSARIARAIETRCFCPPESFTPRSPTTVSYFFSNDSELVNSRDSARLHNFFFGSVRPRKCHILADGSIEKKCVLQDHAQLRAVAAQLDAGQVNPVN